MKLKREDSFGTERMLALAESLVNYARTVSQLEDVARAIWPRLRIYYGHTHLRFLVEGETNGPSFYVDTTQ